MESIKSCYWKDETGPVLLSFKMIDGNPIGHYRYVCKNDESNQVTKEKEDLLPKLSKYT